VLAGPQRQGPRAKLPRVSTQFGEFIAFGFARSHSQASAGPLGCSVPPRSDVRLLSNAVGSSELKGGLDLRVALVPEGVGELDELRSGDPRRIGPYRLEGRLGSGGMGRVYLGRTPGGRHVAIKAIRVELAENAEFRARFAREVSAAQKISAIFTAPVVDADLDGPVPWLATSYVAGPSLADGVAHAGPLSAASVLKLAAGLAEGLDAIHSAGVVHRDLKPSNVILAEDGPRLIDFGISRTAEMSELTHTGMVVGSPGYLSPEQAEGRDVGPPSDIFSLGAVLAFAATGEGPFGGGTTAALLYRVVHSEPETDGLPEEIRPLIERCLAKDPQHRPTATQLLAELSTAASAACPPAQAAIQGLPTPGPAAQVGDGTGGLGLARHPATEQAVPLDLQRGNTPAQEPTVTVPDRHPAGDARAPEPEQRGRFHRAWLVILAAAIVLAGAGTGAFLAGRAGHVNSRTPTTSSRSYHAKPPSADNGPSSVPQPPGEATPPTQQATPPPTPAPSDVAMATVERYYQWLPENMDAPWAMLSPQARVQSGGRQAYETFWSGIRAVALEDVSSPNAGLVQAIVVFTRTDGTTTNEPYQFWVVDNGDAVIQSFSRQN